MLSDCERVRRRGVRQAFRGSSSGGARALALPQARLFKGLSSPSPAERQSPSLLPRYTASRPLQCRPPILPVPGLWLLLNWPRW